MSFMLYVSGSTLVSLYVDFQVFSSSLIFLSSKYLTLKVKPLILLFRCPMLFSSTIKCGCSMRIKSSGGKKLRKC